MLNFQQNRERIFNNFISEYSGATTNQQRKDIILNKLYKPLKQSQHIVSNYRFILNKNNVIASTSIDYLQSYGRFTRFRYNRSGQFDLSLLGDKIPFGNSMGFLSGINNLIFDSNKNIYISFLGNSSYNGKTFGLLCRLKPNLEFDESFNIGSGFDVTVNTIRIDNNDKILVGGWYTSYQDQSANSIIRLNTDGSIDNTFDIGTGFNSIVNTITIDNNNKIYIGGGFTSYQGQTRNRIIRLNPNGSIDDTFDIGTGFNNSVNTITIDNNNKIYVGGGFTSYQGQTRNRIVRLNDDGSIDNTFDIGTGFNNNVNTITIDNNNKIYVGGQFTQYQGQSRNRIIRLNDNGSRDVDFNLSTGFNSIVNTITINDNKIYVGGSFTSYQGQTRRGIIRLNDNGSIDNTFDIGQGLTGGILWFGTGFPANSILIDNDNDFVYLGGQFSFYNNSPFNSFVKLNKTNGSYIVIDKFFDGIVGNINNIKIYNNKYYIVGAFHLKENNNNYYYMIRLNSDGTYDNTFDIGSGFPVETNITIPRIINIDNNNKIYVGGDFTSYQGQTRNRIIRLNEDGSIDNTFDIGTGFNNTLFSITIDNNNKIYVGGQFTSYQDQTRNRIVRLNQDGSIDNTFDIGTGFGGIVHTITIDNNNKIIVGGRFSSYQGQTRNRIIRLNQDGSIDDTFDIESGFNNHVFSIAIDNNNKIYVGGQFTSYQGQTRNRIVRLNQDGSIDNTFDIGTGFSSQVLSIVIDNNNKIIVGGQFTSYQDQTRNRIVRLNQDGSIDNIFNIGIGFNNNVETIAIDNNNRIFIGGQFNNFNNFDNTVSLIALDRFGNFAKQGISEEEFENIIDENINPVTINFKEINEGLDNLINTFRISSPENKSFALGNYLDYIAMKKDEIDYINNILPSYNEYFTNDELQILQKVGLKYFD